MTEWIYTSICDKHPELCGKRAKSDYSCPSCKKDNKTKRKDKRLKEFGTRYVGKVCEKHPDKNGERITSTGECVMCLKIKAKALQKRNGNPVMKKLNEKTSSIVFNHYGNKCCRCGIDDPDVLTIDHTNQDGANHKTESGRRYGGVHLYRWLIKNNFPDNFRTLCYNCNVKAYREHCRKQAVK